MVLNILVWNIRGFRANRAALEDYIGNNAVDIILLQETLHLAGLKLGGYRAFELPSERTATRSIKWGVATFVKNSLMAEKINIPKRANTPPAIRIQITLLNETVDIINLYNPIGSTFNIQAWLRQVGTYGTHQIIAGDFNAHHPSWGRGNRLTPAGRRLYHTILDEGSHCIVNNREPTLVAGTTLDLGVVSNNLAAITEFKVGLLLSDHFSFTLEIGVPTPPLYCPLPRLDLAKADWKEVNKEIEALCTTNPPTTCPDYGRMVLQALNTCIPTKTGRNRISRWYHGKDVRLAKRDYNYILRKYRKKPSPELLIILSTTYIHFSKTCASAKDAKWKAWCTSFNWATSLRDLWNRINRVGGKTPPPPPLHPDPLARALDLARGFADRTDPRLSLTPAHLRKLASGRAERETEIARAMNTVSTGGLDGPLSVMEVSSVLSKLRDSAAGSDSVPNIVWTRLDPVGRDRLTNMLSEVFTHTDIPNTWKCAKVIPIPKPGSKDMRPISLLNTMSKVLERVILRRLETAMTYGNFALPSEMYGFRKRRGCQQCVMSLVEEMLLAHQHHMDQVVIFLDLEKAFEMVDHHMILYSLAQHGIGGKLLAYIQAYLDNRSIEVIVQGITSGPVPTHNGVPQGAVLSPFLFNLVVSMFYQKLTKKLTSILGRENAKKVTCFAYADDLAISCKGRRDVTATTRAAIQCISEVSLEMGFKISLSKSKAMHMFKSTHPTLKIGNKSLEWVKTYKYLGVLLDNKLTFIPMVASIAGKMKKRINLMHKIAGFNWGASGEVLSTYYKATTRALVDYAAPILAFGLIPRRATLKSINVNPNFAKAFEMLERIQYQAARCILGLARTTRVEILLLEAELEPLHLRVLATAGKFLAKFAIAVDSQLSTPLCRLLKMREIPQRQEELAGHRGPPKLSRAITGVVNWVQTNLKIKECDMAPINVRTPWYKSPCKILARLPKKKSDVANHILLATAMEEIDSLRTMHPEAYSIFTDGSLNPITGRAGAAAICNADGQTWKERATDFSSTLTVELLAFLIAIREYPRKNIIIHTDSINAIRNVVNPETESSLAAQIQTLIQCRDDKGLTTILHWVPSHVGVPGNEQADRAANDSLLIDQVTFPTPISASQNALNAAKEVKIMWNASLEQRVIRLPKSNSWTWYNQLRKTVPPRIKTMSRHYLSIVSRIRTGHRRFKDCPHYLMCECGQATFSIPHILISCPLIDYSILNPHRQMALDLHLNETQTAIELIRLSSTAGWGDLVGFYDANVATING